MHLITLRIFQRPSCTHPAMDTNSSPCQSWLATLDQVKDVTRLKLRGTLTEHT
jgi:hypothetical protein